MIEFVPIASSSAGCCYVATCAGRSLLLDCGVSYKQIQAHFKFKVIQNVDACLLSHEHGDHARSATDLMRASVRVLCSKDTENSLREQHQKFSGWHWLSTLEPGRPRNLNDWVILPFDAVHDSTGCLGFMIGHNQSDDKLVFLTDSAYSKHRFEGATILAIEANHSVKIVRENVQDKMLAVDLARRILKTHMSIERLLQMLGANDLSKVREIWLLHLSDTNSDAEEFKRLLQSKTGIPTYIAQATSSA